MPLATETPTSSEPISPGPCVTATPSTCSRRTSARPSAASITGSMLRTWWRDASSGTTPPYGPCTASWDETMEERTSPSRSTAAAVSSHELSIPRTITSARGFDRQEDRVVATPHEQQHALPLATRAQRLLVGVRILHRRTVHLEDHVTLPQPGLGGGPVRVDLGDDDALQRAIEAEAFGHVRRQRLHRRSEPLAGRAAGLSGLLVLQLGDLDRDRLCGLVAHDLHFDRAADRLTRDQQRQLGRIVDRLSVELDDHVALLDPRAVSWSVLDDVRHERAARLLEAQRFGDVGGHLLEHLPEPSARDLPLLLQLGDDLLRQVDRDGEPDADVAAAAAEDRGVDPDGFTTCIQKRSARVARVDGRVGLDEVVVGTLVDVSPERAHDPGRHGVLEPERIPDRNHPLLDLHVGRVTERHGREPRRPMDLDQRDVGLLIPADDLGLELLARGQAHDDLVGVLDHVVVGEDEPVGVDHEARSEALGLVRAARLTEELLERAEELVERVVLTARAAAAPAAPTPATTSGERALHLLGARDVHDRRGDLLGERDEVRYRHGGGRLSGRRGRGSGTSEEADRLAAGEEVGPGRHHEPHQEPDGYQRDRQTSARSPAHAFSFSFSAVPRASETKRMRRS